VQGVRSLGFGRALGGFVRVGGAIGKRREGRWWEFVCGQTEVSEQTRGKRRRGQGPGVGLLFHK
jgi:hypothetical protein